MLAANITIYGYLNMVDPHPSCIQNRMHMHINDGIPVYICLGYIIVTESSLHGFPSKISIQESPNIGQVISDDLVTFKQGKPTKKHFLHILRKVWINSISRLTINKRYVILSIGFKPDYFNSMWKCTSKQPPQNLHLKQISDTTHIPYKQENDDNKNNTKINSDIKIQNPYTICYIVKLQYNQIYCCTKNDRNKNGFSYIHALVCYFNYIWSLCKCTT